MKIKMIARVSAIYVTNNNGKFYIAGYKHRKCVLDSFEVVEGNFNRDHVSIYPQAWVNNAESDLFFDNAVKGDYFEFEADLTTYKGNRTALSNVRVL